MIARWRQLSRRERSVLIAAIVMSLKMRLALFVYPWRKLAVRPPVRPSRYDERESVQLVQWAMGVCHARVPAQTCLSTALAAQRLLARYGVRSDLQIGTYRNENGDVHFHAALSAGGVTIVGDRAMTILFP